MQDLEQKSQNIQKWVKVGGVAVAAFLFAPFALATLGGLLGLGGVIVVSVIGINALPWFSTAVANWRLKALKYEYAKNPIETLENEAKQRTEDLTNGAKQIEVIAGELKMFHAEVKKVEKEYPENVAPFWEQYDLGLALLEDQKRIYNEAADGLDKFKQELREAKIMWNLAEAAAKMKGLAMVNGQDFMAQLRTTTAFESVQRNMATAFAGMELAQKNSKNRFALKPPTTAGALPPAIPTPIVTINPIKERSRV